MTSVACLLMRKPDSGEFYACTSIDFSATRLAEGKKIVRVNFYLDDADAESPLLPCETMLKALKPFVIGLRDIVLVVEMGPQPFPRLALEPSDGHELDIGHRETPVAEVVGAPSIGENVAGVAVDGGSGVAATMMPVMEKSLSTLSAGEAA